MFYDRFLELCDEKGVKPTNACIEAGLSRGLAAKWKSTKTEKPSAEALEKMSAYFEKSIDEILNKQKTPTIDGGQKVEERKKAADPKAGGDDESLEDIIPGYDSLTEENKNRVQDYVAVLLAAQQKQ